MWNLNKAWLILLVIAGAWAQDGPDDSVWIQLWDGDNLEDWDIKFNGYPLNENYNNTFRSVDGNLEVNYSDWNSFNNQFGHAGYNVRPFSFYFLRVEYQHWGNQVSGGPGWAVQNNGMMLHSQSVESMGMNQDFPVSMEAQLLGEGNTQSDNNSTLNLCTPGTAFYEQPTGGSRNDNHCVSAVDNYRPPPDTWAWASFLVLGDSIIRHYSGPSATGTPDFTYYRPVRVNNSGAGGVTIQFQDNEPITEGYITIQAETAPYRFRTIELVNLVGCMDEEAANYKSYLVRHDESMCEVVGVNDGPHKGFSFQFSHRQMKMTVSQPGEFSFSVRNISGEEVYALNGEGPGVFHLNESWKPGLFVLLWESEDNRYTRKVLVLRTLQ